MPFFILSYEEINKFLYYIEAKLCESRRDKKSLVFPRECAFTFWVIFEVPNLFYNIHMM
jgi:hypothetical protein